MSSFEEQDVPSSRGERVIVFADLCGSSKLFERVGNERALHIVGHALAILSSLTVRHRGQVIKTIGDEVMATFPDATCAAEAVCAMQQAVKDDRQLAEIDASIKVGLHIGDVILERGDVYGDAVNVAARMVGLAKGDQIMTTLETAERISPSLQHTTRRLGQVRVRGKALPIDLCELVWQQDTEELTMVGAMPWSSDREQKGGKLILEYRTDRRVVEAQGASFQMGRGEGNDLIIPEQGVSRKHATVEFRKGFFVLADRSTNGTYVRIGAEEVVFVHRDQTHLLKEGVISLGRTPESDPTGGIRYRCE